MTSRNQIFGKNIPVIPNSDSYIIILGILFAVLVVVAIIGCFFSFSFVFGSGQLEGRLYCYLPKKVIVNRPPVVNNATEDDEDDVFKPNAIIDYDEGKKTLVLINLKYASEKEPLQTRIFIDDTELKDWNALCDELKSMYGEYRSKNLRVQFTIKADDNVPMQAVINALNTCKKVGIATVNLDTD
ncbi:MAG: biopolymer transporter ExbD [Candidatus Brocadiia bacterium]